ncbi:MAG: MFS transporter, partial [Ancrocorticia sp.]
RICPRYLLGRLNATFRFAVWGVMPIGSVTAGFLASVIGVVPAMFVFLAGALCASIALAFTPVAKRNRID